MSILVQTQPKSPLAPSYLMLAITIASIKFWDDNLSPSDNIIKVGVIALFITSFLFYLSPFQLVGKLILMGWSKWHLVKSSTNYNATFNSTYLEEIRNNIYGLLYFITTVILAFVYLPFFASDLGAFVLRLMSFGLFCVFGYQLWLLWSRLKDTQQYYVLFSEKNKFESSPRQNEDIQTALNSRDLLLEKLQDALTQKEWKTVEELSKDRFEELHTVLGNLTGYLKESNMVLKGEKMSDTIPWEPLESLERVENVKEHCLKLAEETTMIADALCFKYVDKTGEMRRNELNRILEEHQLFYLDFFTLASEIFISLMILSKRDEFAPKKDVVVRITRDDLKKVRLYVMYDLLGIEENSRPNLENEFHELLLKLLKSGTMVSNGKTWAELKSDSKVLLEQGRQVAEKTQTFIEKIKDFQNQLI